MNNLPVCTGVKGNEECKNAGMVYIQLGSRLGDDEPRVASPEAYCIEHAVTHIARIVGLSVSPVKALYTYYITLTNTRGDAK